MPGENIVVHRVPLAGVAGFVAGKRAEGLGIDVKLLLLLGRGIARLTPSGLRSGR